VRCVQICLLTYLQHLVIIFFYVFYSYNTFSHFHFKIFKLKTYKYILSESPLQKLSLPNNKKITFSMTQTFTNSTKDYLLNTNLNKIVMNIECR